MRGCAASVFAVHSASWLPTIETARHFIATTSSFCKVRVRLYVETLCGARPGCCWQSATKGGGNGHALCNIHASHKSAEDAGYKMQGISIRREISKCFPGLKFEKSSKYSNLACQLNATEYQVGSKRYRMLRAYTQNAGGRRGRNLERENVRRISRLL